MPSALPRQLTDFTPVESNSVGIFRQTDRSFSDNPKISAARKVHGSGLPAVFPVKFSDPEARLHGRPGFPADGIQVSKLSVDIILQPRDS
jgi:hypothetical protein